MRTVFTVGHGARPAGTFVAILRSADITVLVDIRRYPGSRRHPQFGREALAATVVEAGTGYVWQGEALGGHRSRVYDTRHTALSHDAFAGYADHMDTPAFRAAVDRLVASTATETPAVMCAETQWWQCHRMLVADALTMRGATVVHLGTDEKREPHRLHATVRRGDDGWPVYDVPDTLPGI